MKQQIAANDAGYNALDERSALLDAMYCAGKIGKEKHDWQVLLGALRRLTRSDLAIVIERFPTRRDRGQVHSLGCDLKLVHYYQCNPPEADFKPIITPPTEPCRVLQLDKRNPEHDRILSPFKLANSLILDCLVAGELHHRLILGRRGVSQPFNAEEVDMMRAIGRSLESAAGAEASWNRQSQLSAVLQSVLDTVPLPALVFDERANLVQASQRAEQWFEVEARLREQVIEACQTQLDSLAGGAGGHFVVESFGELGSVLFMPVFHANRTLSHVIGLATNQAQTPEPNPAALKKLYRLTTAETRLAILLAQGISTDQATGLMGISRNTVRTHLRAIFAKLGVQRQAVLVQKVLNCPAVFVNPE